MPEYIGASDAAKYLGLTRTVFYRLKDRGMIPFKEIAGRAVFDPRMLDAVRIEIENRKNGRPLKIGG